MNPEFERNLWLEASPRRLSWAGVILFLVFAAVAAATPEAGRLKALSICASVIFVAAAYIWGVRNASTALLNEIGQRTWDFQRLSSLTPFAMTWGKLFGVTALPWAVGLVALVVSMVVDPLQAPPALALRGLAIGVLLQGLSLAAALVAVRKARAEGRQPTMRSMVGGGIFVLAVVWSLVGSRAFGIGGGFSSMFGGGMDGKMVVWWGATYSVNAFSTVAATVFAGWSFVAAWRLMRLELQLRNAPWVWAGFLVFFSLFLAGFVPAESNTAFLRWAAGAFVGGAAAYAAAFIEPADRVRLAGFGAAVAKREWPRAFLATPLLAAPAVLVVICMLALMLTPIGEMGSEGVRRTGLNLLSPTMIGAGLAFLARDVGVILYFRFGPNPRRGDFAAVVALILLYWIGSMFGLALSASLGGGGLAFFAPVPDHAAVSLMAGALQALLVWMFTVRRLRGADAKPA